MKTVQLQQLLLQWQNNKQPSQNPPPELKSDPH
jgi:hypothetical protein